MNGIVLLDKPPGLTSFQALGAIKRKSDTAKVGHAGTLDKFAQGLLIAAAGNCTRLIQLFTAQDKEYRAVVVLGQGTDTFDPEGAATGTGPVPERSDLEAVLPRFRGLIRQRPPEYSAVSVNGVRAYRYARAGRPVELAERSIRIDEIVLEDYQPPRATLRVVCSKGTYIRALARDIALVLGTQAHVAVLTRTRIGAFRREEAVSPDAFDPAAHLLAPERFLNRIEGLAGTRLEPGREAHLASGKPLAEGLFSAPLRAGWNAVFTADGRFTAIVDKSDNRLSYVMVCADQ